MPVSRSPTECACGDHVFAALTRGYVVLVSPQDRALLLDPWHVSIPKLGHAYAARDYGGSEVRMHAIILPSMRLPDHRNGCGTDNRRSNLRPATASQNAMNRRSRRDAGRKGIWYERDRRRWRAQVVVGGVVVFRARFPNEDAAQRAYDAAVAIYHGEFAGR